MVLCFYKFRITAKQPPWLLSSPPQFRPTPSQQRIAVEFALDVRIGAVKCFRLTPSYLRSDQEHL